jgi:starvation-inducible outer membrane lipoprotein
VSETVKSEAEPPVSFSTLLRRADAYQGKTFILGGYVLDIRTSKEETTIAVLQTPLDFRDKPKSKELSEGKFIIHREGFLEPPQSWRGIGITVAGEVQGLAGQAYHACPTPCLEVVGREIHFLPEYLYTDYQRSTDGYVPSSWDYGGSRGAGPLRDPWYDPGGNIGQPRDFRW